ncbi:MAG: DinB family protein [Candidatus Thorarchaeota archaeon]
MLFEFLQDALSRHLDETLPMINQLTDNVVMSEPYEEGRPLGEIILHMLRSIEYYLRGVVENNWDPLPYSLDEYRTAEMIRTLATEVFSRAKQYIADLDSVDLLRESNSFNRPATVAEILHEMLEHSVHHRGQLTVYYRLLGIAPVQIQYIV